MTIVIEYVGIEIRFELDLDTKKCPSMTLNLEAKDIRKKGQ